MTSVPIRVDSVAGLKVGDNRLLVTATVAPEQSTHANAIRVVVFRGAVVHADETIWSSAGESISDEVVIRVPAASAAEDAHDHN